MRVLISVLLLFGFSSADLLYAQDGPWQLRENQDGISVYTRKVADSPLLEYKGHVIMDAPALKLKALFEDEKQITRWYYQCVHSELVETEGPGQRVIYLVLHLPWPVTARDIVFRCTRTEDLVKGIINYSLTALPDRLPRAKGMIRVPAIRSLWTFKSLGPGQTDVSFQQYTEPGGSLPAFLVNELAVDTPYYSLKKFREMVMSKSS